MDFAGEGDLLWISIQSELIFVDLQKPILSIREIMNERRIG